MQVFQDWNVVSWDKRFTKSNNETKADFLKRQVKNGRAVESVVKTKKDQNLVMSARKLEEKAEEGNLQLPKVDLSMSKRIAQARCAQKMSQKDLAMKLNVPHKIIQDYESQKAIPNPQFITKLERILNCKLRE